MQYVYYDDVMQSRIHEEQTLIYPNPQGGDTPIDATVRAATGVKKWSRYFRRRSSGQGQIFAAVIRSRYNSDLVKFS